MTIASNQTARELSRWSAEELIPFGKYLLLDRISIGASAAVYRGIAHGEAGFKRLVTIKRILPHMAGDQAFIKTFIQEAKTSARLSHTNICPIFELGKVGESLYMAMECVIGKDLGRINQTLISKGIYMPPQVAAWIASKLCEALDYAHNLKNLQGEMIGFIHRDISPANILISYEGDVKLIDFGVAKAVGRAQQTNVEALKRKLSYMSPEMVKGKRLDARSDIFGVGVCLYEMVTSKQLFSGKDDITVLKRVSRASVPPPSALLEDPPEELEMILMRALERDPDDRWQSADEMNSALQFYLATDHKGFGVRHITQWMEEVFSTDRESDQAHLNSLLEASKDPNIIEERRRFFSSPTGAAAIARAEVIKKMSALALHDGGVDTTDGVLPPPAKVPNLITPTANLEKLDEEIEELDDFEEIAEEEGQKATTANQEMATSSEEFLEDQSQQPQDFDEAPTSFFNPPLQYDNDFEEDATQIFFNKEEGIGIAEMYYDIDASDEGGPLHLRPVAIQPTPGSPYQYQLNHSAEIPSHSIPVPAVPHAGQIPSQAIKIQLDERGVAWWKSGWALGFCALVVTLVIAVLFYMNVLRKPDTASIIIRTIPAVSATVLLDGIKRGNTPMRMDSVPIGKRSIEIGAEGYRTVVRQVELTKNSTAILELPLIPIEKVKPNGTLSISGSQKTPADKKTNGQGVQSSETDNKGALEINSIPWARVFIDSKDTGRITPILSLPIEEGTYNMGLRTPDGKLHIEKVKVKAGETTKIIRDFTK